MTAVNFFPIQAFADKHGVPYNELCSMVADALRPVGQKKPRGCPPGVLKTNGLPRRVVNFLHDNPEEELRPDDILDKWEPYPDYSPKERRDRVYASLRTAVDLGLIVYDSDESGRPVYRKPR